MNQTTGHVSEGRLKMSGNRDLLRRPGRALLISRTERKATPSTPWVRAIVDSVRASIQAGEVLVAGVGRVPFEVALAACREANGAAIVVLDASEKEHEGIAQGQGIIPRDVLLVSPVAAPEPPDQETPSRVPLRDRLIGELADRAWSIQVRTGGNMAAVAEAMVTRGSQVDEVTVKGNPRGRSKNPPPLKTEPDESWEYLTHYTREPDGRWPDESPAEYADWLAHGPRDARRDARNALFRILSEGVVLGSGRLMPARRAMVSFTARPPWTMGAVTRWRRGLRRWSFRPYGVAVRQDAAVALGARPVRYLPAGALKALSAEERLYAQKHEPPKTDWAGEEEWRLLGSLALQDMPRDALQALVASENEADAIRDRFGLPSRVICEP